MSKEKKTEEVEDKAQAQKAELAGSVKKFDGYKRVIDDLAAYLKKLRFSVVDLENRRTHLEAEVKRLSTKRAEVEQQVKDRVSSMDKSVRKLFDEANAAKINAREAEIKAERLLHDAERKLDEANRTLTGAKIQAAADAEVAERTQRTPARAGK